MILQARSKDNKLFIAMYETEEPKVKDHLNDFLEVHKKWQSSKREYEVRESDVAQIKAHLRHEWGTRTQERIDVVNIEVNRALQKGIDCTFLKNRLELVEPDKNSETRFEPFWTLLPLEDKKENEAVEFANWLASKKWYPILNKGLFNGVYFTPNKFGNGFDEKTTKELYQIFKNPNKQE